MNTPGHCMLCEKAVFEFVNGGIGRPNKDAWRVSITLTDETYSDITFCEECLDRIPFSLEAIWAQILVRFDDSEKKHPSSEAGKEFLKHVRKQSLVKEIGRQLWSEIV